MIKVLIKKLSHKAQIPIYKTEGSSGMDLMALTEDKIVIKPNKSALVPTGLSVAIPNDTEIQIRPRSGLAAKSSISVLNTPGTIDSDYRGEIKVVLINLSKDEFTIHPKDRIAQMVFTNAIQVKLKEVQNLDQTKRGDGGFGSTGKD